MSSIDNNLKEKLENEYSRYMDRVRLLPADKIIQDIEEIAAMVDVHTYLNEFNDFCIEELAWMLASKNPLEELRNQWLYNDKDISDSLNQSLFVLSGQQDLLDEGSNADDSDISTDTGDSGVADADDTNADANANAGESSEVSP